MRVTKRIENYIREAVYAKFSEIPNPKEAEFNRRRNAVQAIMEDLEAQVNAAVKERCKAEGILIDESTNAVSLRHNGYITYETKEEFLARREESATRENLCRKEIERILLALELNGKTADIEKLLAEIKVPGVE